MKQPSPPVLAVISLMLTLTVSSLSSPPVHAGTGGGNGEVSAEVLAEMQNDAGIQVQLVTTGLDQAHRAQELADLRTRAEPALDQWCDQIVTFLRKWRHRANIQTQNQRFALANHIMERAISLAVKKVELDPSLAAPMTLRLLKRGQAMAAMLEQQVPSDDYQSTISIYNFLSEYLQFVMDESNELDRKLVIPYFYTYRECQHGCPAGFDLDFFEHQYLEAARKQLEFPVKHFTRLGMRDGQPDYKPFGNQKVFLNLAQMVSKGVAEDVKQTLSRYAQACTIRDLLDLSNTLEASNRFGNDSDFVDDGEKIDSVAKTLVKLSRRLADGECRANRNH